MAQKVKTGRICLEMYIKWSNSREFKYNIISEHKGEEAGLKSSTIKINGDFAFGWLKNESGIHRLVENPI